jgi:hypothetical protein
MNRFLGGPRKFRVGGKLLSAVRQSAPLPIGAVTSLLATLLYVLIIYCVSGYYLVVPYSRAFRLAFALYPVTPCPAVSAALPCFPE